MTSEFEKAINLCRDCEIEELRRHLKDHPTITRETDDQGNPLLFFSASPLVADMLVEAGAKVVAVNRIGWNVLHYCANEQNSILILRWALDRDLPIDSVDHAGLTALAYAVMSERTENVRFLLENGADPNFVCRTGTLPIQDAIFNEDLESLQLLLDYGANIVSENADGLAPIHWAIGSGNANILRLFLKYLPPSGVRLKLGLVPLSLTEEICNILGIKYGAQDSSLPEIILQRHPR